MPILRRFEITIFFLFFLGVLWFSSPGAENKHIFKGDDLRYINYAVSLYRYGIFGLTHHEKEKVPQPGNANAPFYPALIAGVMFIDKSFAESLTCIVKTNIGDDCKRNFQLFFFVQIVLSVLSLFFVYLLAIQLSRERVVGWLSALLAFSSGVFTEFSHVFMTEILILPSFLALILFTLMLYKTGMYRWAVLVGVAFAILILIRPAYLYLLYGFILFFIGVSALKPNKRTLCQLVSMIVVVIVLISPWSIRNKIHFNSFTLTSGNYAEAILIQRTNYNQMTWPEVGVAMLYWLPDFGDSVVPKIFSQPLYEKLGWGEGTYYAEQYEEKFKVLAEDLGGQEKVLPYLIKEELLSLKHVAVSVPLAFRGMYISKYWGLIGLIASTFLLIQTMRRKDFSILVISLPLFYMVVFHAGLSVSIARYNLPLIVLYALSMAWYINLYGQKCATKIRNK